MNLSKIQATLASATQETTLALANFNFDFSLFKVEAPPSYKPLGTALSLHRRSAAEHGMPHIIARRLGSLFETLIPTTPSLVNAYGARASAISESLGIDPSGSKHHGPFRKFAGVDGTSIWAAATSGPSAVAVHLLACMLARVWSPAEAVSIWDELVTERKKALIPGDDVDSVPTKDVVAANLSIDKAQLAEWDASARAWLRSADGSSAVRSQQKALLALLSTINMPVAGQPMVYDSVCKAWVTALTTIDKLVQGLPYSAQDGSVLVALSSWHLYPDIVVLGGSSQALKQRDELVAQGGALTIGLQTSSPNISPGVHWSLSLAHLRYYGSPVMSVAAVDAESSRLSFPQFLCAALGSLVATLGLPVNKLRDAAKLLVWMNKTLPRDHVAQSWVQPFASVARQHLTAKGEEAESSSKLIKLGYRRQRLLSSSPIRDIFFLKSMDLVCLLKDPRHQVELYRAIYQQWLHTDVHLILRVAGAHHTGVTFIDLRRLVDTDDGWPCYQMYLPEGAERVPPPALVDSVVYQCSSGPWKVAYSASRRQFAWKNPPWLDRDPSQPHPSAAAKQERSRWTLKPKKAVDIEPPPGRSVEVEYEFVSGDLDTVSLYCTKGNTAGVGQFGDERVNLGTILDVFSKEAINGALLGKHLQDMSQSMGAGGAGFFDTCSALNHARKLYESLPGATISPQVLTSKKIMAELSWAKEPLNQDGLMTRAAAFSCIAWFESGTMEISADHLMNVMAISSGDSLYVAAQLLCDPAANVKPYEVHRVVGNIGRAGLAFLIPPQNPMVRAADHDSWQMVNHQQFDGKLEDSFRSTSLHLGFSGYEFPMTFGDHGGRFTEAFFIEAVVSVHDSGRWIADLDILAALEAPDLYTLKQQATCDKALAVGSVPEVEVVSLDNWEELFDPPRSVSVIRAHGNWQARLAAANVSVMLGHPTVLFQNHGCWRCAVKVMESFQHNVPSQNYNTYSQDPDQQTDGQRSECVFVL